MKKLALIITIAGIVGLTSCSKDVTCTKTESGIETTITLTDDDVEVCLNDICTTGSYDNTDDAKDKASAKSALEDDGYSCK